jgi:ferredoxin-NADP reductase
MTPTEVPAPSRTANWQNGRIVEIIPRTPRIKSFFFSLPEPFDFRAGQHVDVRLTADDGYQALRSYSIASAPNSSGMIELAIDLLDRGEVSPFFHEVAAVGDEIEMRGPLGGYFVWSPSDGGPLLLSGGGSGLVPLMAMIRAGAAADPSVPIVLILSARHWEDALYRDELMEIEERHAGFSVYFALTRDEPRRPQDFGRRVDEAMVRRALACLPSLPQQVFLCGSNSFVSAASGAALAAGLRADIVRTERYGG